MVIKGPIDRREFYILVRNLAIPDENEYYNEVIELVERVKMYDWQADLEKVQEDNSDAEIVGYLRDTEIKKRRLDLEKVQVRTDGFGSFLADLPDKEVKIKNKSEYEAQ